MSNPSIVLKATDPQQIKNYLASNEAKFQAFRADLRGLGDQLGVTQFTMRSIGWGNSGGQHPTGYVEEDRKADPKTGFRRDAKTGFMLPALRTEHGKRWKSRLEAVRYEPSDVPGLPGLVIGGGYIGGFVVKSYGEEVFATLGFEVEEGNSEIERIDSSLWAPAKLSEFYMAKEDAEAAA